MNVLGLTLARGGSKGVPNKHTRVLCGKPLIAWTIEEEKKSRVLSEYFVSSDDDDILNIASSMRVKTIKRPASLAQDNTPTLPALSYSVKEAESYTGLVFDYIIEIRATSPLKTVEDIDGCIKMLIETGSDSVIGVTPLEGHHPARAKWIDEDSGCLRDFIKETSDGQRQNLKPAAFVRNGTVYALRRDVVMGTGAKLFGHKFSRPYIMPEERSVNIDTELDFRFAEFLMLERLAI